MILFGAGSSIPFDIPDMNLFTINFRKEIEKNRIMSNFITELAVAVSSSETIIDRKITFDLETLLSILNDLSGNNKNKPISLPTMVVLKYYNKNIAEYKAEKKDLPKHSLLEIKKYIFDICMKPIKQGRQEGQFHFLNSFYNPLFLVLNKGNILTSNSIPYPIKKIYSTNWDICFKTWIDYRNLSLNDATSIDGQGYPYFNVDELPTSVERRNTSNGFFYLPLHGALDLFSCRRIKQDGIYEDITKNPDPINYYEGNIENLNNLFIIYPLETIGFEESIKSPYLDMLYDFKSNLKLEQYVFIIGYSLRDPTIGSILEEISKFKIRRGEIAPLSSDINYRINQAHEHAFKIIILSRDPKKISETLQRQNFINLNNIFIPIQINFPRTSDPDFIQKYTEQLSELVKQLKIIQYLGPSDETAIKERLRDVHKINLT